MYKIEYGIEINDNGRPYISLPDDYEQRSEDKFFAFEITRYLINSTLMRRRAELDDNSLDKLETIGYTLEQISDEIAALMLEDMKVSGEIAMQLNLNQYHIQVNSLKDRDELSMDYIHYNDKLYKRQEGLKVMVVENMRIYKLVNGIDNDCWTELDND